MIFIIMQDSAKIHHTLLPNANATLCGKNKSNLKNVLHSPNYEKNDVACEICELLYQELALKD